MIKKIAPALVFLFLISCKSKAVLSEGKADDVLSAKKIIENHYNNKLDYKTLYIKASARYEDDKQKQNVSADIRIKKDEKILVSIRFLGITMAKALITPDEVKYYEKIGGKYFEGNYSILSNFLGTDLDFQKIQNMLIGQALDNLKNKKFINTLEDNLYKLEDITEINTIKSYFFDSDKFLIKKQEIIQGDKERKVKITYPNYAEYKDSDIISQNTVSKVNLKFLDKDGQEVDK